VLHVDLFGLVTRERHVHAMQALALEGLLPLDLVEEVVIQRAAAEEQPVPARGAGGLALLQEAAERRNAGARPHHDDVARTVGRYAEAVVLLDPHLHVRIRGRVHHEMRRRAGQ
jgi:hypothetical protein